MMLKRKYSQEVKCLKWNPRNGQILSVGTVSEDGSLIEFMRWDDGTFKVDKKCKVSDTRSPSSISWDAEGELLLATMNPTANLGGTMVIVKYSTSEDCQTESIITDYMAPFSAVFKPATEFIYSMSETSKTINVWSKNDSQWTSIRKIKCVARSVRKISFDQSGPQLCAIGENLHVWDSGYERGPSIAASKFPLTSKDIVTTDGLTSRKWGPGPTLTQHCQDVLSVDFSREDTIFTSSANGSICIHELRNVSKSGKKHEYLALCFKWNQVQQYYPQGNITCIAHNPCANSLVEIASGGTDGIVSIWKVIYCESEPIRNELVDKNCYYPEWQNADVEDLKSDVPSVSSISSDHSSEDDGDEDEVTSVGSKETNMPQVGSNTTKDGIVAEASASSAEATKQESKPEQDDGSAKENASAKAIEIMKKLKNSRIEQAQQLMVLTNTVQKTQQRVEDVAREVKSVQQEVHSLADGVKNIRDSMKSQDDLFDELDENMSKLNMA